MQLKVNLPPWKHPTFKPRGLWKSTVAIICLNLAGVHVGFYRETDYSGFKQISTVVLKDGYQD